MTGVIPFDPRFFAEWSDEDLAVFHVCINYGTARGCDRCEVLVAERAWRARAKAVGSGRVGTVNWMLARLMQLEVDGHGDTEIRMEPSRMNVPAGVMVAERDGRECVVIIS